MKKLLSICFLAFFIPDITFGLNDNEPVGWATINAYGQNGTTGGGDATPVVVINDIQLRAAATLNTPSVVHVANSINLGTTSLSVGSHTTIMGLNSDVTITGCIEIKNKSNVIIQNLNITNPSGAGTGDGIEISGSTNVFVTKCSFFDCADGSLDMVRGADLITVSWCRFSYVNQTTHNFVNLIGNSDNLFSDRGKLRITMHNNWWDNGCKERMPRVRFGQVHLFNNYYAAANNNYNIGVGNESQILAENCYFENQKNIWKNYSTADQGIIQWRDLFLVNTQLPTWAPNDTVFLPPYAYTMDAPADVKNIVMEGAGNVFSPQTIIPVIQQQGIIVQFQSYPNPFSEFSNLAIVIPHSGMADLSLFDETGRQVRQILRQNLLDGKHEILLPRNELRPGIYLLRLEFAGYHQFHKLVVR